MLTANLEIVIPVTIKLNMAFDLIDCLTKGSVMPKRVTVIDNSQEFQYLKSTPFDLKIYQDGISRHCHEVWNFARSLILPDVSYVMFLNDDILVNRFFVERVMHIYNRVPAAVVCGTLAEKIVYSFNNIGPPTITKMGKREGICFAINKNILDFIPPIPSELKRYYGDDWYWWWTRKMGLDWYKDLNNVVYHYGGATMKHPKFNHSKKAFFLQERAAYVKIINAIENGELHQHEYDAVCRVY